MLWVSQCVCLLTVVVQSAGHCAVDIVLTGGGGSTCPSAVTSASHQLLQHMNRGNLRAARPVAHFAGPKVGVPALVADPVRRSACCATAAHGLRDLHDILTFPTPARHKTSVLSMALTVVQLAIMSPITLNSRKRSNCK